MSFDQLGLSEKVLEAVRAAGFETPTPIQSKAIPPALARRDVLGLAQTGSGKTAAFALPMLSLLEKGRARARMPRTLVLEPTRELAAQVQEAFERLGRNHRLTIALLIGGVSFDEQNAKIDRGADILIATPGRLLDHVERGKLMLHGIEILVVDEADRMLDMGFIPDIERICKILPITRQTLFFSATMPPEIQRLTNQFLHNPVEVQAAPPATTAASIIQKAVYAPSEDKEKRDALRQLLREYDNIKNAIVFANRKTTVAVLESSLKKHGFNASALHGDMDQFSRLKTLDAFRNGQITYLIASDVAARGLDIPLVSHVFNFDVPVHAEDYVHRVGRTGRAGREGHAYTLVTFEEVRALRAIEQLIKKPVDWHGEPPAEDELADAMSAKGRRRGPQRGAARTGPARKHAREKPTPRLVHDSRDKRPRRDDQQPRAVKKAPRAERSHEREDSRERDPAGFTEANMPAFLLRPGRVKTTV
ncbi:MAG TPA: DEAD/DEAH box helicase [Aestuariivirgaceae bacterium]|jgi:superfamily II DNA/RNA helicase|nr:DEAD/DEAH box helicase [Aestuariivirgaceae bacterium]